MSEAEFTENPYNYLKDHDFAEIPDAWFRSGWDNDQFRDNFSYELARSVSKTGSFALASPELLEVISRILITEEKRALYEYLRNESQRLESEWRAEFAAKTKIADEELPPNGDCRLLQDELREVIESGSGLGFEDLVSEITIFFPGILTNKFEESGETPIQLARRLERTVMVEFLEEATNDHKRGD